MLSLTLPLIPPVHYGYDYLTHKSMNEGVKDMCFKGGIWSVQGLSPWVVVVHTREE